MTFSLNTSTDNFTLTIGGTTAPIGTHYVERGMHRIKDAKALPFRIDQHFGATRDSLISAIETTIKERLS